LQEAAEKYPKDPRLALEAAYFGAPEERRKWLDTFKESAPDNALANYLSASDYLKAGDNARALEELQTARTKSNFQDYFADFVQNAAEAYRAAGYSEADAKTVAAGQALLPYLASLKQVGVGLVDLAQSYRQAGDEASAQAALDMAVTLGARLNQPDSPTILQTLVGIAVEKNALGALDPANSYGPNGETVQGALNALDQQREGIKTLTKPLDEALVARLLDADVVSYRDRQLLFGAQPAIEWLTKKYSTPGTLGQ
jgi:predicted Zn-dependent protease